MLGMLQVCLVGLIRVESNIKADVIVRIDDGSPEVSVSSTEVGGHPWNGCKIPVAFPNQILGIPAFLQLEENHMVDPRCPVRNGATSQGSQQHQTGDEQMFGRFHHAPEYSHFNMKPDGRKVTVQSRFDAGMKRAEEISSTLGIPVSTDERVATGELRIVIYEHGTELWDEFSRKQGMSLDFRSVDLRTGTGSLSHKQPLARAVGRSTRTILDATAGLGHDAFLLACLGWQVHAVERNPIIFTLLNESILSIKGDGQIEKVLGDRLRIYNKDAGSWLRDSDNPPVDVIYLDPMFDGKRSSALPKKPAQILRQIVGNDLDAQELFHTAMECAVNKVVVKRSDHDPPLIDEPTQSYKGKIVRYDVYRTNRRV